MTVLMLIDAVVVFGVSIWAIATNSSAIRKARGCARCCMCCQESTPQAPVIIYLPANQVSASWLNNSFWLGKMFRILINNESLYFDPSDVQCDWRTANSIVRIPKSNRQLFATDSSSDSFAGKSQWAINCPISTRFVFVPWTGEMELILLELSTGKGRRCPIDSSMSVRLTGGGFWGGGD